MFQKIYGIEKFKEERGRDYQDFPSKIFWLALPKNFVGESYSASIFSGIEKFYASASYVTVFDFLSNFFCLAVPKYSLGVIL